MAELKKVLIVGGGFTGMTAAYKLSQDPRLAVTLVEKSTELGGLAAGFPLLGTSLEKTYHHLFLTDTSILELVRELGLEEQLMWNKSSVGVYRGGRVHAFMSPTDLLRFTPCSLAGRLRMGVTALYLKHKKDWRELARWRAHDWMTRACGRSAMETIWTPLLKGKFDRHYDSVSMAWLWARIHIRANSRGADGGQEKLGYFHGGFAVVVRKMEAELIRRGVDIQTGVAVEKFSDDGKAAVIDGRAVPFDYCIFTGPSPALAKLLPADGKYDDYARQLRAIEYLGAICLVFTSDQDIGDYYWLNVNEPEAPFLVFINHTRLVDKRHYQSQHVYYIGAYRAVDGKIFSLTDGELTQLWWDYLKKMFPAFDRARVGEHHVFRFSAAQHIVDTQYAEKIPAGRTPLPGVFLANFSQIFPEDRGTNFAVREGVKIADVIRQEAEASPRL